MVRVKLAIAARRRKKRVLKAAKGQFGQRSRRYRQARRSLIKGMTYAYRDRKVKKREFRQLWILRIHAACQEAGILYSRFIAGLRRANIAINRKMLSEVAVHSPDGFRLLVHKAQEALTSAPTSKS